MFNEQRDFTGHFKKYGCNFTTYDDGKVLKIQKANKSSDFSFEKFKKYIKNNIKLTVNSSKGLVFVDYFCVSIEWINESEYQLYYSFRIERFKGRECYSITFNSPDIDVFGQHRDFVNDVCYGFDSGTVKTNHIKHVTNFKYNGKVYDIVIENSFFSPQYMKTNLHFSTFFEVSSDNALTNDEIIKIVKWIKTFISFCTNRKNVDIPYIELEDKKIGEEYPLCYGELYIPVFSNQHIYADYNSNRMIKLNSISRYVGEFFSAITSGTISDLFISNETDSFNAKFVNTTARIQQLFRELIKNDSRFEIKDTNIYDKSVLGKRGKPTKVTLNFMISYLENYSELDYDELFQEELCYPSFFSIFDEYKEHHIDKIVKFRNDLCHGKQDEKREKQIYYQICLKTLNCIIYGSIMKLIGVDSKDRTRALEQLINGTDLPSDAFYL